MKVSILIEIDDEKREPIVFTVNESGIVHARPNDGQGDLFISIDEFINTFSDVLRATLHGQPMMLMMGNTKPGEA